MQVLMYLEVTSFICVHSKHQKLIPPNILLATNSIPYCKAKNIISNRKWNHYNKFYQRLTIIQYVYTQIAGRTISYTLYYTLYVLH